MYAVTNAGGQCMAFPDVCNTPTPVGPVPIPYPNISQPSQAGSTVNMVLIDGAEALSLNSKIDSSSGDEGGTSNGLVSGKIMDKTQFTLGSMIVSFGGSPAVYLGSMTTQNGQPPNAVGSVISPSQTIVDILG